MFRFSNAGDTGNVNDWMLFALIGFFVASAYIIFVATEQARERRWKSFALISTVGVGFGTYQLT